MARREVVVHFCDVCPAEGVDRDAVESVGLAFNRDQAKVVDLCADHAAVAARFRAVVRSRGRVTARQRWRPGAVVAA